MKNIQDGLKAISGNVFDLTFDVATIISTEQGINNPTSQPRQPAIQERLKLKSDIDKIIDQLQLLKNSI